MKWLPSEKFNSNFLPTFIATVVGVILSVPAGLYLDQQIVIRRTTGYLGQLCRDLNSNVDVLEHYHEADKTIPDMRLPAHGKAFEAVAQKIDSPILIFRISDASESMQEVSELYRQYRLAPDNDKILERLRVISGDALAKTKAAIQTIKSSQGENVCDTD
jgi:hypothetical protein